MNIRKLTADGVSTAQGGARWCASTVQAMFRSADLDRKGEEGEAA